MEATKTKSLLDLCLATGCFLAYSAFQRFDELRRVRPADITFHDVWILIKIHKSKVDHFRKGEEVIVTKTGSELCPIAMLES